MTREQLGFEYPNLKEKCCSEHEQRTKEAGAPRFVVSCKKTHAHVREVAVQGAGPTSPIIACRASSQSWRVMSR